jgi:hypothetical protein
MQPLVFPTLEALLPPGSTLVGNQEARLLSLLARLPVLVAFEEESGEQVTPQ